MVAKLGKCLLAIDSKAALVDLLGRGAQMNLEVIDAHARSRVWVARQSTCSSSRRCFRQLIRKSRYAASSALVRAKCSAFETRALAALSTRIGGDRLSNGDKSDWSRGVILPISATLTQI